MEYKRLLTIQDISCVGQCSLTVALPIISACGVECAILPSAVLSTHTGGFTGFTFRDLTDDIPSISDHWKKEGLEFDTVYTGYLGSAKQIEYVKNIFKTNCKENVLKIVDPAMADNGNLYYGFDDAFVKEMASLCAEANYVLPNITEACFMTGIEYKETYDRAYVDEIITKLTSIGCKNIVLTGISYKEGTTGIVVYENGEYFYHEHEKIAVGCHGTGDIYASAFAGALTRGISTKRAAVIAGEYVLECIKFTQNIPGHKYGSAFEPVLGKLIEKINDAK